MAPRLKTFRDVQHVHAGLAPVEARKRAGLSLDEVATNVGISRQALFKLERGRNPSITTAFRLAHFYETTVDELFAHVKNQAIEVGETPSSGQSQG